MHTNKELELDLEETLQFVVGELQKKKKRQVEDGLLWDAKKSTNPILSKAQACNFVAFCSCKTHCFAAL